MRNQNAEERYRISIRVNRDLLEEIRRAAARDERSINTFLTRMLNKELQLIQKRPVK